MSLQVKVEPIDREIDVLLSDELSDRARSRKLADFAREQIAEAQASNRRALGRVPPFKILVDGRETNNLESVSSTGTIEIEFALVGDVLEWIGQQLEEHSPVGKTGQYKRSHELFADGQEVEIGGQIPLADEYVFINSVPYARKLERGMSSQAPDGVYQVVAVLARRRFGNIAAIDYTFRTPLGGSLIRGRLGDRSDNRNPAIVVKLRG